MAKKQSKHPMESLTELIETAYEEERRVLTSATETGATDAFRNYARGRADGLRMLRTELQAIREAGYEIA